MDYFNDVLITFQSLEHSSHVAVYAGSKTLRFHKKNLNFCVLKMKEGFAGLERQL